MKELLHKVCSSLLHRRYTRAQLLLFLCMWLSGGTMLAEDVAPSKADTIMQDGFIFAYTADGDATLLGPTDKELVTYNIPSTINGHAVKVIGEGAFAQCSKMAKLTIPASITRIENASFNGCTSLSNLVFEDGKSSLYLGYKRLVRERWGDGLFRDCPLEKVYLGRYVYYDSYSNTDSQWGFSPFAYTPLKEIELGSSCTSIYRQCFRATSLTQVKLPETVKSIGEMAFFGCSDLVKLELPQSLKTIGSWAFTGCGFSELTIPNGVEKIGASAFYDCNKLKSISIPASVKEIGAGGRGYYSGESFYGCTSLSEVRFEDSDEPLNYYAYRDEFKYVKSVYLGRAIKIQIYGETNFRQPYYEIGTGQPLNFSYLRNITFSNKLTAIQNDLFKGCYYLEDVTIPATITDIGSETFAYSRMKSLTFESPVPPRAASNAFDYAYIKDFGAYNMMAYVPEGSLAEYKSWGKMYTESMYPMVKGHEKEILAAEIDTAQTFVQTNWLPKDVFRTSNLEEEISNAQTVLDSDNSEMDKALAYVKLSKEYDTKYAYAQRLKEQNAPVMAKLRSEYASASKYLPDYENAVARFVPFDGVIQNVKVFSTNDSNVDALQLTKLIDADSLTYCRIQGSVSQKPHLKIVLPSHDMKSFGLRISKVNVAAAPKQLHLYDGKNDLGIWDCNWSLDGGNACMIRVILSTDTLGIEAVDTDELCLSEAHVYSRVDVSDFLYNFYDALVAAQKEIANGWATEKTLNSLQNSCSTSSVQSAQKRMASYQIFDFNVGNYITFYTEKVVECPKEVKVAKITRSSSDVKLYVYDELPQNEFWSFIAENKYVPNKQPMLLKGGYGNSFYALSRDFSDETIMMPSGTESSKDEVALRAWIDFGDNILKRAEYDYTNSDDSMCGCTFLVLGYTSFDGDGFYPAKSFREDALIKRGEIYLESFSDTNYGYPLDALEIGKDAHDRKVLPKMCAEIDAKVKAILPDYENEVTGYFPQDGIASDVSCFSTNDSNISAEQLKALIDTDTSTDCCIRATDGEKPYIEIALPQSQYAHCVGIRLSKPNDGSKAPTKLHLTDGNGFSMDVKCSWTLDNGHSCMLRCIVMNHKVRISPANDDDELRLSELHVYSRASAFDFLDGEKCIYATYFYLNLKRNDVRAVRATIEKVLENPNDEMVIESALSDCAFLRKVYYDILAHPTATNLFDTRKTWGQMVYFDNDNYVTRYFSSTPCYVPAGMKAGVVVSSGDSIRIDYRYEVGSIVPRKTGMIIKSGKGNSFFMPEDMSFKETAPEDNLLHGTGGAGMTYVNGNNMYYKLTYDKATHSVLGFYWGAPNGAAFMNKTCRAFLALPITMNAQQLQGFSLIDMEQMSNITTNINTTVTATATPFCAYDLNGRRVNATSVEELQPGIYIVNGKKIIK